MLPRTCGALRELGGRRTSYELEGLRDHLLAILVVGHDCGGFGGVEIVGAAAIAGGRRQVVSEV
jgi:hypothetical protein